MKQNEIWFINLDPSIGAEIQKIRPAVIVSDDALGKLPLKVIVPLTDWKEKFSDAPWMVKINADYNTGLNKSSSADCFQIRSISEKRFIRHIGTITSIQSEQIKFSLKKVLSIL